MKKFITTQKILDVIEKRKSSSSMTEEL